MPGLRRGLVPKIVVPLTDDNNDTTTDGSVAFLGLCANNLIQTPFLPNRVQVFLDLVWGRALRVLCMALQTTDASF